MTATVANRFPPQVKYLIGNEAAERFSFYGMKNILTFFLINHLLLNELPDKAVREGVASSNYHLFVAAVYWFPLLGGQLADRFWGKYRTILYLSVLYCAGHLCLAVFEDQKWGFYAGLGLIALGSGGIKPCVSAQVGDQFDETNKHLIKRVFGLFYWSINFGSFFASLLIPWTLDAYGPSIAFGIPGVLMLLATFIFWLGRKQYVNVPPVRHNPHSFWRVVKDGWKTRQQGRHWLEGARDKHPDLAVDGARAVFRVMAVFAPIPVFWALFDQKGSTWIVQATQMDLTLGSLTMKPSQILALNPLMVMLLIPFSEFVLYPAMERMGFRLTPLRRMTLGMFICCISFVLVGVLQMVLDGGTQLSLLWQAVPCLILTLSEIFVSVTGLEFAYSQAPAEMKSTLMSLWNLTVTVGNLLVAGVSRLAVFEGAALYFFYAGLIFLAALAFAALARGYVEVSFFRKAGDSPPLDRTVAPVTSP
jgi:POT family proton-dependent oligopeptide transporter